MPLNNCEINLFLTWSARCFIIDNPTDGQEPTFIITDRKLYVTGGRTSYTRYYLPLVEIKGHNVMIDGRNFLDQLVKYHLITYENIRKIATVQGDD